MKQHTTMTIRFHPLLASLALTLLIPLGALAEDAHHTPAATTPAGPEATDAVLTDGVVRKIDVDAGKLTLKHADIKDLDMPGMTMVFSVKDRSMLDKLKVGDNIRFKAAMAGGKLTLTKLLPVP